MSAADADADAMADISADADADASPSLPIAPVKAQEGELPWVEKHRPRLLADIVGNSDTIARLKVIAQHGNMPNLIIAGSKYIITEIYISASVSVK